jgi:hypothetical protein
LLFTGIHQVLQVEQRAATRSEPLQQLPRTALPLVGVAEEHVPVTQRRRRIRQLLQPDDELVIRRIDPAARLGDPAAGRGVVRNRAHPLRRVLDCHRDAAVDEESSVRRHDGRATFGAPHLMTDP